MKLHELKPNIGAKKNRKRKGIGISAGGWQNFRPGRQRPGDTRRQVTCIARRRPPHLRRLPLIRGEGFTPPNKPRYNEVNLDQLAGLEAGVEVNPALLAEAGMLSKPAGLVKSWAGARLQSC